MIEMAVQSLITGYAWAGSTVTYGFPSESHYGTGYPSSYGEEDGYLPLSWAGKAMLREAVSVWDGMIAPRLVETTSPQIAMAGSATPSTAWAYLPGSGVGGDVWIGVAHSWNALFSAPASQPYLGSYEFYVALHELGHALGLKHPHTPGFGNTVTIDDAVDGIENSVMSYRSYLGGPVGALTPKAGHFPQSLMPFDIAAIQKMCGADYTTQSGNTVYSVSTATGEMAINGVSTGQTMANVVFRTLWDGGGTDLIDLSRHWTPINVDLNPGGKIVLDSEGTFQRAHLFVSGVQPQYATGNIYMSLLHAGDTRSLIENVQTGAGDDVIRGNAADNLIAPGAGTNTVDGGVGVDVVSLSAAASTVMASVADGALRLSYQNGSVTLTGVEQVYTIDGVFDTATVLAALGPGPVALSQIGAPPSGRLAGRVQFDSDGDGQVAAGDAGLGGWTVFLDTDGDRVRDPGEAHTVTAADGSFAFDGLAAGSYVVTLQPDGPAPAPATETVLSHTVPVTAAAPVVDDIVFLVAPAAPTPGTGAAPEIFAQTGTLSLTNGGWKAVTLSHSFDDPVVFAFVSTANGPDIVTARIRHISDDSFQVRLQESTNLDGFHNTETVSYAVMEAGRWVLADGRLIEVGALKTGVLSWDGHASVGFGAGFDSAPVVMSSVQTFAGSDFVTTRQFDISRSGMKLALEEEEALNRGAHAVETVGWLAIEEGRSTQDGLTIEAAGLRAGSSPTLYDASVGTGEMAVFAALSSFGGSDPATVRSAVNDAGDVAVYVQEDTSADNEVAHVTEDVDLILFSATGLLQATLADALLL